MRDTYHRYPVESVSNFVSYASQIWSMGMMSEAKNTSNAVLQVLEHIWLHFILIVPFRHSVDYCISNFISTNYISLNYISTNSH